MKHSHLSTKIMPKGQCPACDATMAIGAAKKVIENFLYELNVDHEETEIEAKKLLLKLASIGVTVSWIKDE